MDRYRPPHLPAHRVAACLGLVSDTHMPQRLAALPPALFEVLNGVDLLLHAGDVGELAVLDRLSAIAPVVAVHGNDDTIEAQRELPYQQLLSVAGQRILLWHSHYPDRAEELASRRGDELRGKLGRTSERARRAGAGIAVFGHWHIPLVDRHEGVLVVNPGAFASGNFLTRQLRQTVALLYIRDDGCPFVSHVDLAAPETTYSPPIDLDAGFTAAAQEYSSSILSPELKAVRDPLYGELFPLAPEPLQAIQLQLAHACWSGEETEITAAALWTAIDTDPDIPPQVKTRIGRLLRPELE